MYVVLGHLIFRYILWMKLSIMPLHGKVEVDFFYNKDLLFSGFKFCVHN